MHQRVAGRPVKKHVVPSGIGGYDKQVQEEVFTLEQRTYLTYATTVNIGERGLPGQGEYREASWRQ